MRRVALTAFAAVCLTGTAHAEGDPRPPLWEFVTVERYVQALVQTGVMALRDQVEFTYSHISADFRSGSVFLDGLTIYPEVPWEGDEPCVVQAERATIATASPASWDTLRLHIALQSATASLSCLMPPMNEQVKAAGINRIAMDHFDIDLDYQIGPGRLRVMADTALTGLASVNLNVDFAYFAIKQNDDIDALLSHAAVTVEDQGLWEKAKAFLPPNLQDPDAAAAMVQGGLAEALQSSRGPGQTRQALAPDQQAFVNAAVREVRRFVQEPGSITIESHPTDLVYLDADIIEDPKALFEQLQPTVKRFPTPANPIIETAKLRAALTSPDKLSADERLTIGKALVTGKGTPKAVAQGRALLEPLSAEGNTEAGLALASVLETEDPAAAYRLALQAGAAGADGAISLLDRLERDLTTPDVLAIQAEVESPIGDDAYASVSAMRSRAMAHLSGYGARRSYHQALYWATLASAAGDRAAAGLVDEIQNRMRYRGDAAALAWQAEASAVADAALTAWLDQNLAARFGRQK
ncbi:MAG: hypothetical protein KDC18_15445 [Alphaproteobacteria bacterium]|nr:hypothetical protein [Alphaproteobacteria bacterium]MCB9930085.1 hypothetical protein [Alphaproteobacteria bacterium]